MARSAAEQARLESILFGSLEYFCGKRYRRDHLAPGSTRVQGVISATVGRAAVEIPFGGQLEVGEDQESGSSCAPDTNHVVGYLLDQFDAATRDRLLARLPKEFEAAGQLPEVPESRIAESKELLKRLRSNIVKTKRGNVVFAVAPEEIAEPA